MQCSEVAGEGQDSTDQKWAAVIAPPWACGFGLGNSLTLNQPPISLEKGDILSVDLVERSTVSQLKHLCSLEREQIVLKPPIKTQSEL